MKAEMNAVVEEITPEVAEEYLKKNGVNRRLRPGNVKMFKKIILNGEWQLTHQGIAFSANGKLLDGQHRLTAIKESGKSVPVQVTRNVPRSTAARYEVDRGAKRSIADILGEDRRKAELVSRLVRYASISKQVSPTDVRKVIKKYGETIDLILECCPAIRHKRAISSYTAAVALLCIDKPGCREAIVEQFRKFIEMDQAGMWPSVKALLKFSDGVTFSSTDHTRNFTRAFTAFNPDNSSMTKCVSRTFNKVATRARTLLGPIIGVDDKGFNNEED